MPRSTLPGCATSVPLIDPGHVGTVESTWSYLFIFPVVLTRGLADLDLRAEPVRPVPHHEEPGGRIRHRRRSSPSGCSTCPSTAPSRRCSSACRTEEASRGPARSFACAVRFLPTSRESFMAQAKGYGDPHGYNAPLGTETYVFRSNGIVPNSSLPLIVRRGAISPSEHDRGQDLQGDLRQERLDECLAQRHPRLSITTIPTPMRCWASSPARPRSVSAARTATSSA